MNRTMFIGAGSAAGLLAACGGGSSLSPSAQPQAAGPSFQTVVNGSKVQLLAYDLPGVSNGTVLAEHDVAANTVYAYGMSSPVTLDSNATSKIPGLTSNADGSFSIVSGSKTVSGWIQHNADGSMSVQVGAMATAATYDRTGTQVQTINRRSVEDVSNCDVFADSDCGETVDVELAFVGYVIAVVLLSAEPIAWLALAAAGIGYTLTVIHVLAKR